MENENMLGTSGENCLGLVIDFASKLKSGAIPLGQAKRFLRGELLDLTVWQTIKLGTGLKTADDFRLAASRWNLQVGPDANRLLNSEDFIITDECLETRLVIVSVSSLGFDQTGETLSSIFQKAERLGLKKCPPELGPQLYLQNTKSLSGSEWFRVGMDPISDSLAGFRIFGLRGDYIDDPLLVAFPTRLDTTFLPNEKFIFMI